MENENLGLFTSVDQFRQLLILNAQLQRNGSLKNGVEKSTKEVGAKLSQLLLKKNGLVSFLVACGDLGGDSFWQNSAALSAVVKILTKKPSHVKFADKYYHYILRELYLVFKNPVWSRQIGLLFMLAVEQFEKVVPLIVRVEVVDRILRPFDVVLERGNLMLLNDDIAEPTARLLWSRRVDEAMWTAARWFDALPAAGPFTGYTSFAPMLSFWLNLLGQAEALNASAAAQMAGTSDGTKMDSSLSTLIHDLRVVCRRLILTSATPTEQAERLLNDVMLCIGETLRYAYFELDMVDAAASPRISSKIQIVGESDNDTPSSNYVFKYANVKLFVREEPHSVQDLVDFTFGALEAIITNLPNSDSCRLLTALLSAAFAACRNANPLAADDGPTHIDPSVFRFTSVDDGVLRDYFTKNEDHLFLPHYILSNLLRIFSDFNFDKAEDMGERVCLELLEVAEKISVTYKSEFNSEKATKTPKVSVVTDSTMSSVPRPIGRLAELLEKLESDSGRTVDADAHALEMASRGAALVELAKGLRRRDRTLFKEKDFEQIYHRIIEQLGAEESFVFLAAINALAELAYWRTDVYLPRMIDAFLGEEADGMTSKESQPPNAELTGSASEEEYVKDGLAQHRLMVRGKIGEALAKVCRQLGDFSTVYFDKISGALLASLQSDADEILRCSALSALADLVHACRGRYFDKILQELLLCVSQLLEAGALRQKSNLERRGAIHLLRSMLQSASNQPNGSIFEVDDLSKFLASKENMFVLFMDSLAPITAKLKFLWQNDSDDVIRLHAELALIEIENAVSDAFNLSGSACMRRINLK